MVPDLSPATSDSSAETGLGLTHSSSTASLTSSESGPLPAVSCSSTACRPCSTAACPRTGLEPGAGPQMQCCARQYLPCAVRPRSAVQLITHVLRYETCVHVQASKALNGSASRSSSPPLRVPSARSWPLVDLPPVAMTREERVARCAVFTCKYL